jgi:gem associated protein 8
MAWQGSHYSYSHFGKSGHPAHDTRRTQTSKREDQALSEEEEEMETESDEEIECDLSNMEITDELRQYFAETERHREERSKFRPLFPHASFPCPDISFFFFFNLTNQVSL